MTEVRTAKMLRSVALVLAALLLPACAGLPLSGGASVGLKLGESSQDVNFLPVASGPIEGAGPERIVEGFLEAGITTADNWATAREFLSPELQRTWRPAAGVSIDVGPETRTISSIVPGELVQDTDTAVVQVELDLIASVDEAGAYADASGASSVSFTLERMDDGEWRITEAPDGIVLDDSRFAKVYDGYPLQYFDLTWSRLVPDMRWFPRRQNAATTVTQALVEGAPSEWLDPAVQGAFPTDVQLAQDAVPLTGQVAEVALTSPAVGLDDTTLSRMRTQLQATLKAAGVAVTRVDFTVDGRRLDAGVVDVVEPAVEIGTLVLKDGAFGRIIGDEISPIAGISSEIAAIAQPIVAIDVASDDSRAAVQLGGGHVYLVSDGSRTELDTRPGLIEPSLDSFGYTWSVPERNPAALQAWEAGAVPHAVANAWPQASAISAIRVAGDGSRVAAVVTVGKQLWVVVAGVVRDFAGVPVELGEARPLIQLTEPAIGLVWLSPNRLGVLVDPTSPQLITQMVGGPGTAEAAPSDAVSVAGSQTTTGVRILGAKGQLFARAGTAWREVASGVSVLATRVGE